MPEPIANVLAFLLRYISPIAALLGIGKMFLRPRLAFVFDEEKSKRKAQFSDRHFGTFNGIILEIGVKNTGLLKERGALVRVERLVVNGFPTKPFFPGLRWDVLPPAERIEIGRGETKVARIAETDERRFWLTITMNGPSIYAT